MLVFEPSIQFKPKLYCSAANLMGWSLINNVRLFFCMQRAVWFSYFGLTCFVT